ncbi:MAG: hypothetical protein OQK07_10090, partial [Rhodospirillales bacterium]|nr:hypothetical protein [Rhodospirillales bacterium]
MAYDRKGKRTAGPAGLGAFAVFAMMLTVMAGPSWAQTAEIRPLLDRIDRLERDIETLSRNVYRGGASGQSTAAVAQPATAPALSATEATGPAAARLNVRITDLESEVRAMTGS